MFSTLRFYGRRKGRPLNAARQQALAQLEAVRVTLPAGGMLNPATLFTGKNSYTLEIGFGNGEHLAACATATPATGFIGAEPFISGQSALLQQMDKQAIKNIRIFPDDARLLLDALVPNCLDMVTILFSDPWPKARHAERRFINADNLARLARVIKAGGHLRLATDSPILQDWYSDQMAAQKYFSPSPGLFDTRPPWPATRYEAKAIKAGRHCKYWEFTRTDSLALNP